MTIVASRPARSGAALIGLALLACELPAADPEVGRFCAPLFEAAPSDTEYLEGDPTPCVEACAADGFERETVRALDAACLAASLPGCAAPQDEACGCDVLAARGYSCSCLRVELSSGDFLSLDLDGSGPTPIAALDALGAVPVTRDDDGAWRPTCRESADHLRLDLDLRVGPSFVEFLATAGGDDPPPTQALRPGGWFRGGVGCPLRAVPAETIAPADFAVELADTPAAAVALQYEDRGGQDYGVAVLVDESDADAIDHRIETLDAVLAALPAAVPAIAFRFAERWSADGGIEPLCELPIVAAEDLAEPERRRLCYSRNRSLALAATGPPGAGADGGRRNLWQAVEAGWRFLAEQPEGARHLIVITDGPDTCAAGATACSSHAGFVQTRDFVAAERAAGRDVHLWFVHFGAREAGAADPRMAELACAADGHVLNGGAHAHDAAAALVRGLPGSWGVVVDVATLVARTTPGTSRPLDGTIRFSSRLARHPEAIDAPLARHPDVFGPAPTLTVRCQADAECVSAGCDAETGRCTAPAPEEAP